MAALTDRVEAWRRRGADAEFHGRRIFTMQRNGADPTVLFLHGFPSSSYDWRPLLDSGFDQGVLAFDFLGFGLSEKPRDADYSLLWQADLAEELVRRRGEKRAFVVAHDMGTSVANELMAREIDGKLSFEIAGVLLLNGSMVQDAATPTLGQRLLRGPLGPVAARLSSERFFRAQFGSIFSPRHPLSDEEAADQWSLLSREGGARLGHRTIAYMDERMERAERWHGALRAWSRHHDDSSASRPGSSDLSLAWGMLDPVATPQVLAAVRALAAGAAVTEWEDLGHYPQIEDPGRVAEALRLALAGA